MPAVPLDLAFVEIAPVVAVADTASVVYVVDTAVVSVVVVAIAAVYPLTKQHTPVKQHTPMKIAVVVVVVAVAVVDVATEEGVYRPSFHQNYHLDHHYGHHPTMQFLIMMSSSVVMLPTMPTLLNYVHHS
jgi:hypothetical protein